MTDTPTTDLTPEAVDAHINRIDPHGYAKPKSLNDDTKTLLRALSAALEAEKNHKRAIAGDKIDAVSELRQVKARLKEAVEALEAASTEPYFNQNTLSKVRNALEVMRREGA